MKCYIVGILIVISNMHSNGMEIQHGQLDKNNEVFTRFKNHWDAGSKGFPALGGEFPSSFNFERQFAYEILQGNCIKGTLLEIAVQLNDYNGIKSIYHVKNGLRDRDRFVLLKSTMDALCCEPSEVICRFLLFQKEQYDKEDLKIDTNYEQALVDACVNGKKNTMRSLLKVGVSCHKLHNTTILQKVRDKLKSLNSRTTTEFTNFEYIEYFLTLLTMFSEDGWTFRDPLTLDMLHVYHRSPKFDSAESYRVHLAEEHINKP